MNLFYRTQTIVARRPSQTRKKILSRWDLIKRVMKWARGEYFPTAPPFKLFSRFLQELTRILETQGAPGAIAWIKRRRSQYLKYLASPVGSAEERRYRGKLADYLGWRGAAVLLQKSPPVIRMMLTAHTALRSISLPVMVDLTSVIAPFKGTAQTPWAKHIPSFWKVVRRFHGVPRELATWSKCHFTQKAGPNGPALTTALIDLESVTKSPIWESVKAVGGWEFSQSTKFLLRILEDFPKKNYSFFPRKEGGSLRKLVGIPDKEGKTRVIAILDYWSQEALRPLHAHLFKILRRIPQDMTFTQGSFLDKVRSWGKVKLHSVDLTNATDRFPIDRIRDVLEGGFGKEFSDAWKTVMVGLPFRTPDGKEIFYSVGNPMGAQSSWSSFTLAHHYLMYWCSRELQIPWNSAKYVILGDDVLIGDDTLATLYHSTLIDLGVDISEAKSFASDDLCEFAKRYIYMGEEVSPFPISSVLENIGDASLLVSSLTGEFRKGLRPVSGIPEAIESLSLAIGRSHRTSRWIRHRAQEAYLTTEFFQGTVEPGDYVLRLNHPLDEASADYLTSVTPLVIKEVCYRLARETLLNPNVGLIPPLNKEWREIFIHVESDSVVGAYDLKQVPLLSVSRRYALDLGVLANGGLTTVLEGGSLDPVALSDFFVSPLSSRTWRLDKRKRMIRGWSKFGSTLRKVAREALQSYSVGTEWAPEVLTMDLPHDEGLYFDLKFGFDRPGKSNDDKIPFRLVKYWLEARFIIR